MKVIYIITGLSIGGAETVTVNLASKLMSLGHECCIFCLTGKQIVHVPENIKVYELNMKKTPMGFIKALVAGKKLVKVIKPNVVHANMFHAIIYARLLRLFVHIPRLVCTEHSMNYHGEVRRFIEGHTDFLSDVNTHVAESATAFFVQKKIFKKEKTQTVINGIDVQKFSKNGKRKIIREEYKLDNDDFLFVNVGRFNEAKDHKNLVRAFSIVLQQYSNARLMCVGTGELEAEIKQFASELELDDFVIFTGAKSNVVDFYNTADCFVLSSQWEGLPIAIIEAMACELPVVTTECGKEVLQNPEWTVQIKNSEQLANKMAELLLLSKEKRKELGIENRKKSMQFSIDSIASKWLEIYSDK